MDGGFCVMNHTCTGPKPFFMMATGKVGMEGEQVIGSHVTKVVGLSTG